MGKVFMTTILGLALIIVSIYFLGQNIVFTTQYYYDWWHKISATGSVLSILAGVGALTFWRQQLGQFGWILVAIGIVLVFLSGGVILRPTSLWTFFVAMLSFASGYQLLTKGRMRF
jgi:hypothetical protein